MRKSLKLIFTLLIFSFLSVNIIAQSTIYVNASATGSNNGTSWTNAYTSLQSALNAAVANDEIWVAKGTYKPSSDNGLGGGSRYYYFAFENGVDIYGGFLGTETSIDERDNFGQGEANETIFSGDLNGDDVGFTNNTENCYHVFYSSSGGVVVDGFTISGGNADGTGNYAKGGGMYLYGSGLQGMNRIVFMGNSAIYGGGLYSSSAQQRMYDVVYAGNIANYGGAVYTEGFTDVFFYNTIFSGNKASIDGGGIYNVSTRVHSNNSTITGNHADNNGGGIYSNDQMYSLILNSILWGNSATNSGAQVYLTGNTNPALQTAFKNCDIQGGSTAFGLGYTYLGEYENNIDSDPLFVTPVPTAPSTGGDLHLLSNYPTNSSPCYEAGNNEFLDIDHTTDFDGNNRLQIAHVDMGVYEGGNAPPTPTIYVDINASGNNYGTSWADAFTDLQWAMLIARTCHGFTTIEVAEGTYKTTDGTDRDIYFEMIDGINILGGYPTGGGTRDWENNETILSGDLSANDIFDVTNYGFQGTTGDDNSYHVFFHPDGLSLTNSAVLDGVTISGGNAINGANEVDSLIWYGAGMYNYASSPTVINCTFSYNRAAWRGGGMYSEHSSPVVTNCNFTNNVVKKNSPFPNGIGGGMYNFYGNPSLSSCIFSNNYAHNGGGGMASQHDGLTVVDCIFSENMVNDTYGEKGGGMAIANVTNATITNCSFINNYGRSWGGGMYLYDCSAELTNLVFSGNSAQFGGGIHIKTASPNLNNVSFFNNTATYGGGMNCSGSSANLNNASFFNNSAGYGGAVYVLSFTATINNSILWGNQSSNGNEFCIYTDGIVNLNNSCYSNSIGDIVNNGSFTPSNCITSNPLYVNPSDGDLRLCGNSPAVNMGQNSYNTTSTDVRGEARIQNTTIDMGAYEWTSGVDPNYRVIYVDKLASGNANGASWTDAYTSLQTAMDATIIGDQIWVAKGTYKPSYAYELTNTSRYYHFRMIEGVEIYGGFAGTQTLVSQRTNYGDGEANETILSGDLSSNDNFDVTNGGYQTTTGDDNCYHVLFHPNGMNLTSSTILDGFTISGGNANNVSGDPHNKAGGMYLYSSSPTIQNVIFHSNEADNLGGAAYIYNSTSIFTNISFLDNISAGGGALYVSTGSPVLNNVIFTGNISSADGGALSTHSASTIITNALFSSNTANNNGGAIIFYSSSVQYNSTINNVSIAENQAGISGGGIRFASNNAASALTINNCVVWGNTGTTSGNELSLVSTGNTTLNYSCYSNDVDDVELLNGTITTTNNNITLNPLFINATSEDYRLYGTSPCVNTGNNSYNSEAYDIRDEDRVQNTTIDMGAYEWTNGVDPATNVLSWTGNINSDWNEPGNWSENIAPTEACIITIPSSPSGGNFPIIPTGTNAKCKSITLEVGAILIINGNLDIDD